MVERPKVGVGVFIRRDGKILVGQRQGSHGAGTWSLPGGHLEFGESIEACAQREVLEETGMSITQVRHVDFTNDVYEDNSLHYITLFVRAEWVSGEPKVLEPEKCSEWRWVAWPDVPEPRFLPLQNFITQGGNPFHS